MLLNLFVFLLLIYVFTTEGSQPKAWKGRGKINFSSPTMFCKFKATFTISCLTYFLRGMISSHIINTADAQ